ncbi:very-long-chain (3R)-3-hydroxyacyl-CoA dehydratase 4 isoform X3 [Archocentrus centrarchus]|nr:very-long-chain (3R)-3-hydroxyacyl-CoA dehydratase 4 isoform X3 [Archocentrus centrarchus]
MSLCQLLSILELFHIADGIEKARLLPRFIQVCIHSSLFNEILPSIMFCLFFSTQARFDCLSIFQVMEKNLLLIMIIMLEELQSKPVVCAQFFFWNILDLLRYPHELLCIMEKPSTTMLWTRYSLWIPLYILSVIIEGVTIYQALPYVEQTASHCAPLNSTIAPNIHLPFVLVLYLPVLTLGASVTVWQLLKERQHQLEKWNKKRK